MERRNFIAAARVDDDDAQAPRSGAERLFNLNYQEIWAGIYRSRFVIAGIFVGALLIAILITVLTTPVFRGTSTVQIDQETTKVLGTEQDNAAALGAMDTQRFLNTQLEVLNSRGVATMVADDLRLFNNADFLRTMGVDPEIEPAPGVNPVDVNRQAVLGVLARNLNVAIESDSRIVKIEFSSPDPVMAARIANSYADNFIRNNLRRKFDTSSYSRNFLRGQLDQAQVRLEQAERALVQFSTTTRIIDASNGANPGGAESPRSLLTASLIEANNDLSQGTAKRIEAQQRWEQARRTPLMSLPEVLGNSAVQQLVQERATAQADYQEQMQRRKADYPLVQQAKAKVDEIDRQLQRLASGIRQSIQNQYLVSHNQERAIGSRLNQLKQATLDEQRQGIQLSVLRREADTARQQFETLLRRFNQLNAEAGVQTNNIAIIDRAPTPSDPSWPKIPLNLALALVAAIIASIGVIFVREQLLERVRKPDDVVERLQLPLLGTIPDVGENAIADLVDPKTPISEAFNSVRTSLSLSSKKGLPRSITFVSAAKGEGKSTACFATALGLAKLDKRVVVLDLDLRLPTQHKLLNVENVRGMSDVLATGLVGDDVILPTAHRNVSIIPSGPIPPNPTELLSGERLGKLLEQLLVDYDVVLIDSPPVLGLADALLVSSQVEATVFVIRSGIHSPKNVQIALRRLQQGVGHIVGAVLTRFDAGRAGYGYSQNYSYKYA